MAVWYLDNDAEITDAVARLRGTSDEQVIFVVPPGSRIATGRINFKLLLREAESRAKAMAVVSADEQVRALATSAGVLAVATVDLAQAALERGDLPPTPGEIIESAAGDDPTPPEVAGTPEGEPTGRLVWRSQRLRVATVVVLALALVGVFAASQVLPRARIMLQPRVSALGPIEVEVLALPSVTQPDVERGQIPAVTLPIPLDVQGTFTASGSTTIETRADGEVVFSSPEQPNEQAIPAGTRVKTPAGVEFQTTEAVTLPPTEADPAEVTAAVEAVRSGEEGNVPPGAISVVSSLEGQGISVRNPAATSGGRFEERPQVTAEDYDAAAVDLQNRLAGALVAHLRDSANTPADLNVYPETAQLGTIKHDPAPEDIVGASVAEFELSGAVIASVLGVDTDLVDDITRARLLAAVPAGTALIANSATLDHNEGTAESQRIRFTGRGDGETSVLIDADALVEGVAGLPVSEAQAILERLGTATVSVWPEFLTDLPADHERIELDITEPSTTE